MKISNREAFIALFLISLAFMAAFLIVRGNGPFAQTCGEICPPEFWQSASHQEIVEALETVDVHGRSEDGRTPLHWAARYGGPAALSVLVEAGADVNIRDERGRTPLHDAARYGTPESISVLLGTGADVNATTTRGDTPLHEAAELESSGNTAALIEAGADVNTRNGLGQAPINRVRMFLSLESLFLLLEAGADVNAQAYAPMDETALHQAVTFGTAELVLVLLHAGADVNARDARGRTPLHKAAVSGTAEILSTLIAAGADVNARSGRRGIGSTPLHLAVEYGNLAIRFRNWENITLLLEAGADVHLLDEDRRTPWSIAQDNEALQGRDAYWALNEARFE